MDEIIEDDVEKGGRVMEGGKRDGEVVEEKIIDGVKKKMEIYKKE